jgi:hypothetical protein
MLKKSASGVLALLRGSTYRSVGLAPLLAAVLPAGFFEHPDGVFYFSQDVQVIEGLLCGKGFSTAC